MTLTLCPLHRDEAAAFVLEHHRHLPRVGPGYKFALGALDDDGGVVGVIIVGRPLSRHLDDSWTLEVTRLASTGARNVCSFLYGAAWRAARALGYRRLVTYTLESEPGTSLRAAGWREVGSVRPGRWGRTARPRIETGPLLAKRRWEVSA
ncbi:MAG: hypothetical protein KIT41_14310 [Pyrinomonadaceae bacterium]|nr:hypothetical protein [Pyrinomonadaceae bacterium]